ncbi:hypothetical protein [Edaphobacter bradus]|uniref:hypothetical protein n=1 Tax=Edaphobacter bradus TaxID=2259016 RepID=UPI0021E05330|nr:hypothetical protein [Edaphobacter bradus]
MNGSLLGVIFLVVLVYSIGRSNTRWRTALFSLGTVMGGFLIGFLLSLVFPKYDGALGTLTGLLSMVFGIIAALDHSRRNPRPQNAGNNTLD